MERKGKVFTKPVDKCTKQEILPIILKKVAQGVKSFPIANYLKETEWRFNNRGKIEKMLRKFIRKDRQSKNP